MAVLIVSIAALVCGFAAGWVFMSSYSAWEMSRIVNRQQREIIALREHNAELAESRHTAS
ncbi:hypothetical protein LP52_14030 [Streptomonospora alba]|uniref:LapA family protein n=1 Tax=Streptomonospora alba TaxID=183763 RepID=A0A0C2G4S7_9ACTN|nr:hypothetical protein [Streptomonospora alba]KIH98278.1 hypothetical protein LP52_14030 [Streptomonospora alba]